MVNLLFYLFAIGTVVTAVGVILAKNPVVSVISLLGSFFCVSVIYLLAGFQFMAAIQILVYAGAIMVLFLFVVMLLNLGDLDEAMAHEEPFLLHGRRAALGIGTAFALGAAGLVAVLQASIEEPEGGIVTPEDGFDPLGGLAEQMFTRYSLPFEAASLLLLATAVGILVLAKRQRPSVGAEDGS